MRGSLKFRVLNLSHTPGIKKLSHREGESSIQTETRNTRGVTDCSSVSALWRVGEGGQELSAPGLESRVLPYSSCPSALKDFREWNGTTLGREATHIKTTSMCPGGILSLKQVILKISKTALSTRRPAQTTHSYQVYWTQCCKALALGETGYSFLFSFTLHSLLLLFIHLFFNFNSFLLLFLKVLRLSIFDMYFLILF